MPDHSEVDAQLDKAAICLNASADNLAAAVKGAADAGQPFPSLQPAIFNLGRTTNHLLAAVQILNRRSQE